MKVYIVFDDCPVDFSDKKILDVYGDALSAHRQVTKEKKDDPYKNQYLTVVVKVLQ